MEAEEARSNNSVQSEKANLQLAQCAWLCLLLTTILILLYMTLNLRILCELNMNENEEEVLQSEENEDEDNKTIAAETNQDEGIQDCEYWTEIDENLYNDPIKKWLKETQDKVMFCP